MKCDACGKGLFFRESVAAGRCGECRRAGMTPARHLVLALADRIHACHEILSHKAERRAVVLTETDYCPLSGSVAGRGA